MSPWNLLANKIQNLILCLHCCSGIVIIPTAFEKAHRASNELVHIPKNRKRAQDRYSFLQDGLAGLSKTWSSTVKSTEPSGEFYTLMMAGNIKLTAAVKPWRKKIRPAKYRISNSRLNKFLTSPHMIIIRAIKIWDCYKNI